MGWNEMKQVKSDSKDYVKLQDGESIVGVFAGDPVTYYQRFKDRTHYQEWAEGRSFKFEINFIEVTQTEYTPRVLKGGRNLAGLILDAKEEYGMGSIFKIKRTGSGKDDTRYSILFQAKLTPKQKEQIAKVKLFQLDGEKEAFVNVPQDSTDDPPLHTDDDVRRMSAKDDDTLPF